MQRHLALVLVVAVLELGTVAVGAADAPPTPTPTVAPLSRCVGDCNGDGRVTIAELQAGVDMVLGVAPPSACEAFCFPGCGPGPGYHEPTISCVIRAVNNALNGCRQGCAADQDCDVGNFCMVHQCIAGSCVYLCLCV